MQKDGKLVAAGYLSSFRDGKLQTEHIAIARYNSDGSLDGRFGKDGKVVADAGGSFDRAYDVALQKDGNVLVAGGTTAADGSKTSFVLARFTPGGSPDASFGKGGRVTTVIGETEDTAYALAIQPDGRILAGGYSTGTTGKDAVLVRYDRTGKLDPTFGRGGILAGIFGGVDDCINALVLQADGKIIATGNTAMMVGSDLPAGSFAMARLNTEGSLDATFGNGGLVLISMKNINCVAHAVALQADGKVVTAGTVYTDSGKKFAIARYLCR